MTMKIPRRKFLRLAAGAAVIEAVSRTARAQAYPSRAVHWIVPYPPGGPTDILARLLGKWLSERLGQPFVVDNRPGASGNIGTELVVRSAPDGYTLLLEAGANVINDTLFDKLGFNFMRDVAPVAGLIAAPLIMEVNPSVPARTVPEFIAYAKANPGRINMASAGNGTPQHVAGELFKMMAGIDMIHVPYRGSAPAVTNLLGGQVQVMFDTPPASIEHIRAGTLRPLAVTSATRAPVLPDVPVMSDFLPGYEATAWYGVGTQRNVPAEIVERLNREINAGLADPDIKARLTDLGGSPLAGSAADFGKFLASESGKWAKVIKFAGIKPIE
jgi:tripartite-type tricarboxylate transporter receptor subunit TctC